MSDALDRFARTPRPPYFAVIFTSQRAALDVDAYARAADRMLELARARPGFLGVESARDAGGFGLTVSYWTSEEAIAGWKRDLEHLAVQRAGRDRWYEHFELRVAKVERASSFTARP